MPRSRRRSRPLPAILGAVAIAACGGESTPADRAPEPLPAAVRTALGLDRFDPVRWVRIYDPERAVGGYTLALHQQEIPVLFDMSGRIVHAWPGARLKHRVRLLPDGSLLGIALGRGVAEYDWDGRLVWEYRPEEELPHHDVIRLANGNTMILTYLESRRADHVLEIDRSGRVVWRWRSEERLLPGLEGPLRKAGDITHINSVQELPDNPWHRAGDDRFRPGNLLLSARNLDLVFIVDRRSGEVVWSFGEGLDLQHEALMTGADWPRPGTIVVFNNRYAAHHADRQSEILEIDPRAGEVVRRYRAPGFYSPTSGVEQPLAGGNLLVASSRGGRAFEVDEEDRIVWEWTPRYRVNRPSRYPYDHTPQLAALARPDERPVRPPAGYAWVDGPAYRFARHGERRTLRVGGRQREYLADNDKCARIVLPAAASVDIAYGLDPAALRAAGRDRYRAEVTLSLRAPDGGAGIIELHRNILDLEQERPWHREEIELGRFSLRTVELCVGSEEVGVPDAPTEPYLYWEQPHIRNGFAFDNLEPALERQPDLTTEELEARRRHLRAMGYVD